MKIQYSSMDEFYDGIYQLLTRGVQFNAHARDMTVTLTGGY